MYIYKYVYIIYIYTSGFAGGYRDHGESAGQEKGRVNGNQYLRFRVCKVQGIA